MKILLMMLCAMSMVLSTWARPYFNTDKDILIAQYDSRPDPDDIHAQAGAGCMLAHEDHASVNYYAVQGAYGIQGGAFIDSATLFNMAFGTKNTDWTDAHNDWWGSVGRIHDKTKAILNNGGKVWVAEAGQSNITADWIFELLKTVPAATVKSNVIIVQHSNWNEDQTASADLTYVKDKATYYAIDDGNAPYGSTSWGDRGAYSTPQYNNAGTTYLAQAKASTNPNTVAKNLWTEADRICDTQSYHPDWSNITPGGVDFSDTVEIWWILNVTDAGNNQDGFWTKYVTNTPTTTPPSGSDTVSTSELPTSMESQTSYTVSVPYTATTSRDVVVEFWNTGWLASAKKTVSAGSGTATFTLNMSTAPAAGNDYIWKTSIRPVGTDWTQNIDKGQVNGVVVTVDSGTPDGAPIGKTIALKSLGNSKYVNADSAQAWKLVATQTASTAASTQYLVVDAGGGLIALKASGNGKYACADKYLSDVHWYLAANRSSIGAWEKFTWVENSDGSISLKANGNGKYVCADRGLDSANWPLAANRTAIGAWEKFTIEVK